MKPLRAALYHRASTLDQDPALCRRELRAAAKQRGCTVVLDIEETGSGLRNDRPGMLQVMDAARRGKLDIVLVWRLSRWGRSSMDLQASIKELQRIGVTFVATSQGIEVGLSRNPLTNLVLNIMSGIAEYDSETISEGTIIGMEKAAAEGTHCGRPRTAELPDGEEVLRLRAAGKTWGQIALQLHCDRWEARRAAKRVRPDAPPSAATSAPEGAGGELS